MFIGSINRYMRCVLESAASQWRGLDVYVACSGNFTVERILSRCGVGRIFSNDVSIYSCALGWHLTSTPKPFVIKASEFNWLEPYILPGPALDAWMVAHDTQAANPDVRDLLDQVQRRMRRPGIAVLDFEVRGDIGLPKRDAGRSLAELLLRQFGREDGAYRLVGRDEFVAQLVRLGLSMDDAVRNPLGPQMRRLGGVVRYIVVGNARHGSINLSATLLDLSVGKTVQTAEVSAPDLRALSRAMGAGSISAWKHRQPRSSRTTRGRPARSGWKTRSQEQ